MRLFNAIWIIGFGLLLSACQGLQNYQVNSVLWVQTSAEYEANTRLVYTKAKTELTRIVKNHKQTSNKPLAVILDIDETILDNSLYNGYQIKAGNSWDKDSWDKWVSRINAGLVPGADTFLQLAFAKGVEVLLVSNRECRLRPQKGAGTCPQKKETIENLNKYKIKIAGENIYFSSDINGVKACEAHLKKILHNEELINKVKAHALDSDAITAQVNEKINKIKTHGWPSEKKYRRECIKQKYNVVMLIGDDLGDFVNHAKSMTMDERRRITREKAKNWGETWFMLPNPMYGSWRSIIKESPIKVIRAENL